MQLIDRCVSTLLIFVLLFSCNELKDPGLVIPGYDFYPLEIGAYRIYEVEEIKYRITSSESTIYQLKETIYDSIHTQDQIVYLLRRDIRLDASMDWESDSLWSVSQTTNYLSITENNIPFMKLTFPVKAGNTWNGNSLNTRNAQTYYFESLDEPLIDTIALENHIRVVIEDIQQNVTGVDLRSEVYARGVGLIKKDYLTQVKCTSSSCGEDLGKVVGGRSLKQVLIEIGNE